MLDRILFDNPEIDDAILHDCQSRPEYRALEADCDAKEQALRDAYIAWCDAQSAKWGYLSLAYYHKGLGLRQELSAALGFTAQSAS